MTFVALPSHLEGAASGETAEVLIRRYRAWSSRDALADLIGTVFAGRIALVSSFGAESVVLLDLVARMDRHLPVLFLDTGRHFPETLAHRRALETRLGLTDVRDIRPDPAEVARRDPEGDLWRRDADACCALRKTEPLERALAPFSAWITGRKRFQSGTRAALELIEQDGQRVKINPLWDWSAADIAAHIDEHELPLHPLTAEGFASIGCAPCTSPVAAGEDARAGRWRGSDKTECGIHIVDGRVVRRIVDRAPGAAA